MRTLERKADTRRKIELGGLVKKAGLDSESTAVIYGALLDVVERLQEKNEHWQSIWRAKGDLAFSEPMEP